MPTLVEQMTAYVVRSATEFKSVYGKQGDLASLNTSNKANLVQAINEVDTKAGSVPTGAQIDDSAPSTITVYSSVKTENLVATRPVIDDTTPSGVKTYSSAKSDALFATRPVIDDVTPSSTKVYSSSKVDAAIGTAVSAKPNINDAATNASSVWSSTKTNTSINAAVSALVSSAPAALDTLNELAAALGSDPNFATTMNTALGYRVRVDAPQAFTGPQQQQGRDNLAVLSAAQIGDPTTNFVTVFNNALL